MVEIDATPTNTNRRAATSMNEAQLHAVLNHVDYGLAVVEVNSHQLLYANGLARSALRPDSPSPTGLCITNGVLCPRRPANRQALAQALARTVAGLRGLLNLGHGESDSNTANAPDAPASAVAVMPLAPLDGQQFQPRGVSHGSEDADLDAGNRYALLVFSKQQVCDTTSVTLFARDRGLTGAEGQVLAQVCKGLRPQQIATQHGVQVSTVRSQLRSIRQKTASVSMRELVSKVSVLPPLARQTAGQPGAFGNLSTENLAFC